MLSVPKYRDKYLANVRLIAEDSLNWSNIWSNIAPFIESQAN